MQAPLGGWEEGKDWLGLEADGEWAWRKEAESEKQCRFPALTAAIEIRNTRQGASAQWSRKTSSMCWISREEEQEAVLLWGLESRRELQAQDKGLELICEGGENP